MQDIGAWAAVWMMLVGLGGFGCRSSEAGPGSGLTPPPGWQALPSLATAATEAAKQSRITVDGAEEGGDTARGCYAGWISFHGTGGATDTMAEQFVTSLSAEPALGGIAIRDVQKPAAGAKAGVLALTFDVPRYRGRLRATLASDGKIAALACFWNQREPAACERACSALAGSMK